MYVMIKITHNEATVEVPEGLNVWKFLEHRNVKHPKYVVFELDGDIIPQDRWETTFITEDSEVEHSYLAGGG